MGGDDEDAVKTAFEKLGASQGRIGEAIYQAGADAPGAGEPVADETASETTGSDEDIVDAEVVDDEPEQK